MEKDYQFWNVLYESLSSGETIRACVSAKTKKAAWSEAERQAENTGWRVKAVTEMKLQMDTPDSFNVKNEEGEKSAEKTGET